MSQYLPAAAVEPFKSVFLPEVRRLSADPNGRGRLGVQEGALFFWKILAPDGRCDTSDRNTLKFQAHYPAGWRTEVTISGLAEEIDAQTARVTGAFIEGLDSPHDNGPISFSLIREQDIWKINGWYEHGVVVRVGDLVTFFQRASAASSTDRLAALMSGNEASAIGALRAINSGQASYAASCGNGSYATALTNLATPPPGASQGFINPALGSQVEPIFQGYRITLGEDPAAKPGPSDCNGRTTVTDYYATATPISFGRSGARSFATDTTSTIWQSDSAVAPVRPFGPPARPFQ